MSELVFRGQGIGHGVAFGKVHLVDRRRVSVPRYRVPAQKIEAELERFENAIEASEAQLEDLRQRAEDSGLAEVELLLQAHGMLLRDQAMRDATRERISRDHLNAEWALREEVKQIRKMFDGLEKDYFKERRSDADLVSDRVMRNLVGAETEFLDNLGEDAIVVAYELSPADTVALARYSAKGFVTETGGPTSHTAILVRAMNVPAVLGVHGIMERVGFGDELIVDAEAEEVVLDPSTAARARYRATAKRRAKEEAALLADRDLPAETTDGVRCKLLGNIEVHDEITHVKTHGGEGIGLYRTEFLVIERHRMPTFSEHATEYTKVVRAVGAGEVAIRTIDIGGDKFVRSTSPKATYPPQVHEANPALGLRAIRISLRNRDAFRAQLQGILRASAEGDVRIILPFVTGVDEVREAKVVLEEAKEVMTELGQPFDPDIRVGIMVETPAAVWIADVLAKEVDFFSIGTNDLIQYSLAVDRGNDDVAYLYRPCSPVVLRMLDATVRGAATTGIEVTLCGEMAADPFNVPLLLGLGIQNFSMSATSIPLVKRLIRRVSLADCEALVRRALHLSTADEVEREVARSIRGWEEKRGSGAHARPAL